MTNDRYNPTALQGVFTRCCGPWIFARLVHAEPVYRPPVDYLCGGIGAMPKHPAIRLGEPLAELGWHIGGQFKRHLNMMRLPNKADISHIVHRRAIRL